ncbi:adenosylcobinamide-GDP ribazoletransferase [Aliiruegeria sabulilitoris]|uniref:adenosylcobinamide-GDP ribazoletransferase n=1 Tax=Aliiruegeria sabulilitoris TaxID=1510458 RepID=UPI00082E7096|nr:adenosylcobinamide-GDP ribazoletransferase [Aliiruegeria sabulilitoris]NDR56092.1 adenosylcobinamide-GDP ribazoletransferase [Pseudoruegeria sp. M32A2M]
MAEQRQIIAPRDIALACALLTRLPVPVDGDFAARRGAGAAWAYPLAGLLVALIAGGIGWAALWLGLSPGLAAGLVLTGQVVMTGAMHEDGLADSADGLWGGWTRERRLEIMKDSRIGSYGVLAMVLALGLRWNALIALGAGFLPALLVAALLSRAVIVVEMAALPNARDGGMSRSIGRPRAVTVGLAVLLAAGLSLAMIGWTALLLLAIAGLVAFGCAMIARVKIGGQTGDILGATQQVSEIAILAAATVLLP